MTRMLALALALAPTVGCIKAIDRTWDVDANGVALVIVQADKGDVTVVGDQVDQLTADVSYGGLGFGYVGVDRVGDQIRVDLRCDGLDACGGDVQVRVPHDLPVDVLLDAGDIDISGLSGPLVATLGAGDVRVGGHQGDDVDVALGAGDIDLDTVVAPRWLRLDVGAGNASATLPGGAYDLRLDVAAGHLDLRGLDDDDDAAGVIDVHVGTGAASLTGL